MSSFDTTLAGLGINRTATGDTTATAARTAKTVLGQDDFLALMTAQLKNQDPFSPVDNTQMVAQMAQFSSVAGISQMNTTLAAIAAKLAGTSTADAMSYVGRSVLTEGDTAYARASGGIAGAVELDKGASDVTVTIRDATGATLKTIPLGANGAGTIAYEWDGKTDAGAKAPDGPYTVSVTASDGTDKVAARNLVWAPVQSVSMQADGSAVLNAVGIGGILTSDVRAVG